MKEDIFNRYQAILLTDPPFTIKDNIPHVDNVRKFRLENKSDLPKTIYIYENGKLIKGSPFNSYSEAHKLTINRLMIKLKLKLRLKDHDKSTLIFKYSPCDIFFF